MSPVLDTHILVWWRTDPSRLSSPQRELLDQCEKKGDRVRISAITLWELAKLAEHGRLTLSQPVETWLREIESHSRIETIPLNAAIVAESTRLGPDFHRDPADQLIAATARVLGVPLITADDRIRRWGRVALV